MSIKMDALDSEIGAQMLSSPPFIFALGLQGELIVSWLAGAHLGIDLRMHVSIPAEEVTNLKRTLDEYGTIQEMLAARKPEQGAH